MIRPTVARRTIPIWGTLLALLAVVVLLGVLLLALSPAPAEAATTFTVNNTGDAGDRRINDSVCDTLRKKGKQCTLRAAIEESNDTPGADTINFKIGGTAPVKTINVGSKVFAPLPDITEAVTINGYTQSGASANTLATGNNAVLKIQLNGTSAGGDTFNHNGFKITASNSTIKGLVINRFAGNGVQLEGSGTTGNKIEGNFIGTTADGTGDLGNDGDGVLISTSGALDNTVGGTTRAAGNVISGNGGDGVSIVEGTGNSVLSNRIFSNTGLGIALFPDGATANDDDDPDTGANNLQNFPVITSVIQSSQIFNPTKISGTLNSTPSTTNTTQTFTVQCFLAGEIPEDADASGHGEGVGFVAEDTDVTTNSSGDASFECNFFFPRELEGTVWSATATNETTGDTSEFSANFTVE
jgi:hypothetical protein